MSEAYERRKEKMRAWQRENPEKLRAARAAWRKRNPLKEKECQKRTYQKNRTLYNKRARAWIKDHPDGRKFQFAASDANQRYPGKLRAADVAALFARYAGVCCWCEVKRPVVSIEHLKPINDPLDPYALAIACRRCNSKQLHRMGQQPAFLVGLDGKKIVDDEKIGGAIAGSRP